MRRLLPFLRRFLRHRARFLAGVLSIPVVVLCDVKLTLLIGDAINRLEEQEPVDFLPRLFFLLLAVAAVDVDLAAFQLVG